MYEHKDRNEQEPKVSENVSISSGPGSPPDHDGETANDDLAEEELRAGPAGERKSAAAGGAQREVSSAGDS